VTRTARLEAIAVVRAVERCAADDPNAVEDAQAIYDGSEDRAALVGALGVLARNFTAALVGEGNVHAALDALVADEVGAVE
jgi:hypothetical protein